MNPMRYRWTLLDAGRLLLDGGSMFGLIPRVVWTKSISPDEKNRIALRHNCLLLEGVGSDPALGRPRRVLIESGTGDKLDPKMRDIFGLDGRTVESAVMEAGVSPEQIDSVVVTHLHFDHAGGLTRRARGAEAPAWRAGAGEASGDCDEVSLTFPNAEVIAQQREWADALDNVSVMTRTYYRDHLEPIRPRVRLVNSARPFAPGYVPRRDELPGSPAALRRTEVLPGVWVLLTPGHTWGQQAIGFTDESGRTIVFTPDVMPTAWHVGAAYSLSYDVEPYTSMVSRRWFLAEASASGWTLVLDHDPRSPVVRVHPQHGGWYALEALGDRAG